MALLGEFVGTLDLFNFFGVEIRGELVGEYCEHFSAALLFGMTSL
tara:strand:+ start:66 stop:200 length:135 start_codon:yes stop_codon:yes gene_type:complete